MFVGMQDVKENPSIIIQANQPFQLFKFGLWERFKNFGDIFRALNGLFGLWKFPETLMFEKQAVSSLDEINEW